jgi:hypothetical protein
MEFIIKKFSMNTGATTWFRMFEVIVWKLLIIEPFFHWFFWKTKINTCYGWMPLCWSSIVLKNNITLTWWIHISIYINIFNCWQYHIYTQENNGSHVCGSMGVNQSSNYDYLYGLINSCRTIVGSYCSKSIKINQCGYK